MQSKAAKEAFFARSPSQEPGLSQAPWSAKIQGIQEFKFEDFFKGMTSGNSSSPGPQAYPKTHYPYLLILICLLAALLRLWTAWNKGWYGDEGYVAELSQDIHQGYPLRLGSRLWDGIFPLSCSWLVPLSQLGFAAIPKIDPMLAARLWSVCLESLSTFVIFKIAEALEGSEAGLCSALLYAISPFGINFGGRAFYHHLGILLFLIAFWRLVLFHRNRQERAYFLECALAAGLACASCYWIWWFPFGLGIYAILERPKSLGLAILLFVFGAALPLLASILSNPGLFMSDFQSLSKLASLEGPKGLLEYLKALWQTLSGLPFLLAGPAALILMDWRKEKLRLPWILTGFFMFVSLLDPIRQRGNMSSMPYPYQLFLPWNCLALGCACKENLGSWRLEGSKIWKAGLSVLALIAFAFPLRFGWLDLISVNPDKSFELRDYLFANTKPGDLVIGLDNLNWLLDPKLLTAEAAEPGLWAGLPKNQCPSSPASFAYDPSISHAHFIVLSKIHILSWFYYPGVAYCFLRAEEEGWPKVFDNHDFRVFENPVWAKRKDPKVSILQGKDAYRLAISIAHDLGQTEEEKFALKRWELALPSLRSIP